MARIAIVGAGHVGLVTGVAFARAGHEVTCADVDMDRINQIQEGEVLSMSLASRRACGMSAARASSRQLPIQLKLFEPQTMPFYAWARLARRMEP